MTTQLERIKYELELAGFKLEPVKQHIKTDDDYSQSIGTCVQEICKLFSEQGHSGYSAECTLRLLKRLLIEGDTLSPLTNDPSEWNKCDYGDGKVSYQSKRKFSCFSDDNLKTYYDLDDPKNKVYDKDNPGFFSYKQEKVKHTLINKEEN